MRAVRPILPYRLVRSCILSEGVVQKGLESGENETTFDRTGRRDGIKDRVIHSKAASWETAVTSPSALEKQ